MDPRPELGFSGKIWAILLEFGLFSRIWVRRGPKGDKALWMGRGDGCTDGWMYVHTDGQIPPVFYRTSSPSGPLPKKIVYNFYDLPGSFWPIWPCLKQIVFYLTICFRKMVMKASCDANRCQWICQDWSRDGHDRMSKHENGQNCHEV